MFKFLRSKKGQGMVEYGLIICAVAIAAIIGLNAMGNNNADRTMEIAETLEEANTSFDAESKDVANKTTIGNYNSGNGGYYSGGGGGGLGSFPTYSGGVNWSPSLNPDGTQNENDRIGFIDDESTETGPVLNEDAPEGNQAPVADFYVVNEARLRVGDTITVYNTSNDPDGDAIVKEEWSGIPADKKFTIEGEYTIRLRVVDEWGNWSQWFTKTIVISNTKPVAVITSTPEFSDGEEFDKTQIFQWSSSASYDPDGHQIVDQEWSGKQNNYSAGEHTIKLRVKDSYGTWSEWTTKTFNIFDGSRPVITSGTVSDAKNSAWSIDIFSQTEADIPQLISQKDIFFKTDLSVTDEDRDSITSIQYRIDGNTQNTLYNITSSGSGEAKNVLSPTSNGVPTNNSLSIGRHSIELRVRDDSGAWSDWSNTFYIEILNLKEETGEDGDGEEQPETPEYMTMEVYSYNPTSQSAVGGNKGPWTIGDFIIMPEDKTGVKLKDAVIEINGQEIESTFTTIAGQDVVLFSYTTPGVHTLKAKFLDENDIWSDYVVKDNFILQEINIYLSVYSEIECSLNCISIDFSTDNSGLNTDFATNANTFYSPYYNYFTYRHENNAKISAINVKVDNEIVKTISYNEMTNIYEGADYIEGNIYDNFIPTLDLSEPHTISLQAVDVNGVASKWTNTVTVKHPEINEDTILPAPAAVTEITAPFYESYIGWTPIFTKESLESNGSSNDDHYEYVALSEGKTISFNGQTYTGLYVDSNLKIQFGSAGGGSSQTVTSSSTNNSIVLISNADLRSNAYYKETSTGIDILFAYEHYSEGSHGYQSKAVVHINFDGTGKIYFVGEQDPNNFLENYYGSSNLQAFVKTSNSNYSTVNNPLSSNSVFTWTNNSSSNPYYTITASTDTIPAEFTNLQTERHYEALFINGTKITTSLTALTDSSVPNTYEVTGINGSVALKNLNTNQVLEGTFTSNCTDYYNGYPYNKCSLSINEIPGLTHGTYEMSVDNLFVSSALNNSYIGYKITNNTQPINITLIPQDTNISNLSLSINDEYMYVTVSTNNYGSTKDLAELTIDNEAYTQVFTIDEAKTTPNSFYIEPSVSGSVVLRLYNSSFELGTDHTIKTKIHILGSEIWSNQYEKTVSLPKLSVSSVSISSVYSTSTTNVTTYLNNYTGKEIVGVKLKVDGVTATEDTSITTASDNYITKAINILEPGSHEIKVTVLYKTKFSETIYETEEFTTTRTQSDYGPQISGLSTYTTTTNNFVYKVTYSNSNKIPMKNTAAIVTVNGVDVSSQVSRYTYSTDNNGIITYEAYNIPKSVFSAGTNTIKIKVKYRKTDNLFEDYTITNEKSTTRSITAPTFSSLSVDTAKESNEYNYLTLNYSNSNAVGITGIKIYVNDTLVNSEVVSTNTSNTSSSVKIPALTTGSAHTIKAQVTFNGGTVIEKTITYTAAAPLRYSSSITHNNKTSNAAEYLTVKIYTPTKYEFSPNDFIVKFNNREIAIDKVTSSYSSGSYSTSNGTMKYRYTVDIYPSEFLYREGSNTINVIANIMNTEITFNTLSESNSTTVGKSTAYPKVDNKTDPNKLYITTKMNTNTYYRVQSLVVKEYSDSNRTNLIAEHTLANPNQYKYVGTTFTDFGSIPITNPENTHYYTLTFVTPWGTSSEPRNFTYAKKADYIYSTTLTYQNTDYFNLSTSFYVFNAALGVSSLEVKFDSSDIIYTSSVSAGNSTSIDEIPVTSYTANNFGSQIVNPSTIMSGSYSDDATLKYRIKYTDNSYSEWLEQSITFNYPKLNSVSSLTNEDTIIDGIPAFKIALNTTNLSTSETFEPEVILDGQTLPVLDTQHSSRTSYYIWVEQPESGIYHQLSIKLKYNDRYTNTVTKKDFTITKAGEELLYDVIPVTRTTNVTMPSFNISEYTKLASNPNNSNNGHKITLSTPLNFLGTSVNAVYMNAGTIAFSNTDIVPTPVLNNLSNDSKINESLTGLDNNAISVYPNSYELVYASERENSGVYYKETTNKLYIIYNNLKGNYFKTSENTYPYFTIFVEIDKTTGSGHAYYSDLNPTNDANLETVFSTTNTGACPRTFVVKKSSTEYGYVKAWYSDPQTQNPDSIFSNTKFSWSSDFYQELPPVINSITYVKTSIDKMDVTINYTSRSESNNVQTAKLITTNATLSETFSQVDNSSIIMRNIPIPTNNETTMFAQISIDNLTSSLKPFMLLSAPKITQATIQSDFEKEITYNLTIENPTNARVIDIFPVIRSRTTSETITAEIKNKNISNTSISFKTDLLPQDFYFLSAYITYQDIGDIGNSNEFIYNFTTTVNEYNTTTSIGSDSYYLSREIEYPADISFSTAGFTQWSYSEDYTTTSFNLPSGKYVNFAGTEYDTVYLGWDAVISFTSSFTDTHGPGVYDVPDATILPLGYADIRFDGYYKVTNSGIEFIYKYAYYSAEPDRYVKVVINNQDGSGKVYYQGVGADLWGGEMHSYVKVNHENLTAIIDPGSDDAFTEKAYEWYKSPNSGFTTVTPDSTTDLNSDVAGKTYVMKEITYPNNLSVDTSDYTLLVSGSDSYNTTITLPAGKFINFAGQDYNKIYLVTDGVISFSSSGNSSHAPKFADVRNLSIVPLGGLDTSTYVYYKIVNDGVEILYKYAYYSNTPDAWIKTKINYNGTGEIYFIGSASSSLGSRLSNLQTFVKVSGTDYSTIIAAGQGSTAKYTNKAYAWVYPGTFQDIPTITNLSFEKTTLEGGKTEKLIITTNKPINNADVYIGSELYSFTSLVNEGTNTYSVMVPVPNNLSGNNIAVKVRGNYYAVSSYWKSITVPYTQSAGPVITGTSLQNNLKQNTTIDFTINYTKSALNSEVADLKIQYANSSKTTTLTPTHWSVTSNSTITVEGLSLNDIPPSNISIKIQLIDTNGITSNIYTIPVTISENEAPVITSVKNPIQKGLYNGMAGIPYKSNMVFTLNITDPENDNIQYVYYRSKTTTDSGWSSITSLPVTNTNIEVIDKNTINVTIPTPYNNNETREYEFSVKDNYNQSNTISNSVTIIENSAPIITEIATIPETTIGSRIDVSAIYTDVDKETDSISEIYVYIDNELVTQYQTAYTDGYEIKVRNLLLNKVGEYNISILVKDKYEKLSNKMDTTVKVLPSDAPILYSYSIDEVLLGKDILLKDIYFTPSQNSNTITALEYIIDDQEPVVIDFETPITTNNFSYSLQNTAPTTPSEELKYIFIRIKDDSGTWSSAIMGTYKIGYFNDETTTYHMYIDWYEYYASAIYRNQLLNIDFYGYGFMIEDLEAILKIDGVEIPGATATMNSHSNDYMNVSLNLADTQDLIAYQQYRITIDFVVNGQVITTTDLGTFIFLENNDDVGLKVYPSAGITATTNTNKSFSTEIVSSDWNLLYGLSEYGAQDHYAEFTTSIDGVSEEDYSINLNYSYYDEMYGSVSYSGTINSKIEINSNLRIKATIKHIADENLVIETNEVVIPIKVEPPTTPTPETFRVTSLSTFKNINRTLPDNNVLAGVISYYLSYRAPSSFTGIEKIEVFVDGSETPVEMAEPTITASTSSTYKYGNISSVINYTETGTHTFKFVLTDKEGNTAYIEKECNIVPNYTPTMTVTKEDGTVIHNTTDIQLTTDNTKLVFTLNTTPLTAEYSNIVLRVNNVKYGLTNGSVTVDFSYLNQGYYKIELIATTPGGEFESETVSVLDKGVSKLISNVSSSVVEQITFPNSLYVFGNNYNTLYISGTGAMSTKSNSIHANQYVYLEGTEQLIVPALLYEAYMGPYGSEKINGVYYKMNTDNITLFIDAVDNFGARVYYAVSFYNRDNIKFTYYIIEGSTAAYSISGISQASSQYVYTNIAGTVKQNNSSVLIDTYNMTIR